MLRLSIAVVTTAALAAAGAVGAATVATGAGGHAHGRSAVEVGFVIGNAQVVSRGSDYRVEVPMLTDGRRTTVVTQAVSQQEAAAVAESVAAGALVDFAVRRGSVVVPDDAAEAFHTALTKGTRAVFDTQKYGPELAPRDGRVGDAVAAGWVYDKDRRSITVGDGRVVTEDISGRSLPEPDQALRGDLPRREGRRGLRGQHVRLVGLDPVDVRRGAGDGELRLREHRAPAGVRRLRPQPPPGEGGQGERDLLLHAGGRLRRQAGVGRPDESDLLGDKGIDPVSGQRFHGHQRDRCQQRAVHAQHRAVRDRAGHLLLRRRQRGLALPLRRRHGHPHQARRPAGARWTRGGPTAATSTGRTSRPWATTRATSTT